MHNHFLIQENDVFFAYHVSVRVALAQMEKIFTVSTRPEHYIQFANQAFWMNKNLKNSKKYLILDCICSNF